ncbi:MAG: Coq4 family protein [Nostoc sp.]|uniref:Coq4 family protein n=1 Tax=Nostoc sp. TaxID=1180 RepID=UPI002FFC2950
MSKSPSTIDTDMNLSLTPELLKALQGFVFMINDGLDIDAFFDIEAALANHEVSASQAIYLKSNPEIAQLFEEQYIAPTPNLEILLKLPEDSLGFTYASNLRASKFEQEFYPKVEVQDDVSYLNMRVRQTHDIWHAVTGYGYDVDAGIKLAGFQVAQLHSSSMVVFLAALFLNTIKMNRDFNQIVRLIQEGYDLGYQAKPFLAQKWEEAWEKSLADWRLELNVNVT